MTVPILERVSLPSRPGSENDDVTVVSLRGELDIQDERVPASVTSAGTAGRGQGEDHGKETA